MFPWILGFQKAKSAMNIVSLQASACMCMQMCSYYSYSEVNPYSSCMHITVHTTNAAFVAMRSSRLNILNSNVCKKLKFGISTFCNSAPGLF